MPLKTGRKLLPIDPNTFIEALSCMSLFKAKKAPNVGLSIVKLLPEELDINYIPNAWLVECTFCLMLLLNFESSKSNSLV